MPLAKPTKPDAITAVPTPVPLRTDRANFAVRGDAMMGWFPTGIAGVNTTLTYFGNAVNFVEQEANEAEASATAAAASNVAAGVNAAAAAASAGATVWVTGTTYAAGVVRYSPTNYQTYRDTVGGVSNTDPASDTSGRWISAMLPSVEAIGLPAMPPTAVFNFASGVIDRRFVELRSTAGTRYNIFGNLETLAAGVAKPTYDPATNEAKGYLAEPAATYLAMRSTEMDNGSYWVTSNATVTASSVRGIDGELSMYKVEASATASVLVYRVVTASATAQYYKIRAKKGSGTTDANKFAIYNSTTAADIASLSINYDTGVITQTTGTGATAVDVGQGIWEIYIPATSGISIGNTLIFYGAFFGAPETSGEYAYIGFPDVADKPNLTHIPTAGSNVTTVAGGLTLDLTTHDDIVNPQGFTIVFSADVDHLVGAISDCVFAILRLDGSNYTYIQALNGNWRVVHVVGGVAFASILGAVASGGVTLAASFQTGACYGVINGGSVVTMGTSAALPGWATLFVGAFSSSSGDEAKSPIKTMLLYPRACTDGELIALVNNI